MRRLSPYFRNVGKRLTKAPKLYLRDTGLLHHLLNINSLDELGSHPIRGASWETFVLEDMIRREHLRFPHSQCYFWRTQAGAEVDLVLDRGSERFAIEIKAGRGDKGQVVRVLEQAKLDLEAKSDHMTLVHFITSSEKSPLAPLCQRGGQTAPFTKGGRVERGGILVGTVPLSCGPI